MNTIRLDSADFLAFSQPTILVLGYFDGLHRGHQAVFARARELAQKEQLPISVLTFPESPKLAFTRFSPDLLLHLASPEKRCQLLAEEGVDTLYLVDFTSHFAAQTPEDFVKTYLHGLQAQIVVTGFDYHFGNSRADVSVLQELFAGRVEVVEEVQQDEEKISSTRIRQAIAAGQVAQANQLLGYAFSTRGMVVHGDARGRTIGYPTANLAPIDRVHLPADGVYVADVEVGGKRYQAMASIGKNMTFDGTELRIEAHIFGFDQQIYGETVTIYWLDKLRDMVKFAGVEELMLQMKEDQRRSLVWKSE